MTKKNKPENKQPLKIRYTYKKPENEEGVRMQKMALDQAFDVLFKEIGKDRILKKKLDEFPGGFQFDGDGYACHICEHSKSSVYWYDKYGVKCLTCQAAIDRKEIPASLAKDRDSWYSAVDLEIFFNANGQTIKKWIKKGVMKVRTIINDDNSVRAQLFLIEDNKDVLPPKNLVKSQTVKEVEDGQEWYCSKYWYEMFNPYKHLKGYKILDHLTFSGQFKQK